MPPPLQRCLSDKRSEARKGPYTIAKRSFWGVDIVCQAGGGFRGNLEVRPREVSELGFFIKIVKLSYALDHGLLVGHAKGSGKIWTI
jgi:hypothetical protein